MDTDEHNSGKIVQSRNTNTKTTWKRGFFMLVFVVAFWIGEILLMATAVFQFFALLTTGKPNELLVRFGNSLSKWIAAITQFLTCASDEMPFPWAEWPSSDQ